MAGITRKEEEEIRKLREKNPGMGRTFSSGRAQQHNSINGTNYHDDQSLDRGLELERQIKSDLKKLND